MRSVLFLAASSLFFASAACAQAVSPDQEPGRRFEIRADALPAPYADKAASNGSEVVRRGDQRPIVPEGFEVSLFAEGLRNPRKLLVLGNGDVLLAEQKAGSITFLRDADGDGKADSVSQFAKGFDQPYGMAIVPDGEHRGELLVADRRAIWRLPFKEGDRKPEGKPVAVTEQGVFGSGGGHSTRSLAVDPKNGTMYAGIGSAGNIGEEKAPRATIQRFDADGGNQTTFVSGTRNPIGIHFHPQTGRLWGVVQERDGMGSDLVPDYLAEMEEGDFYGWPYAYSGGKPQPDFSDRAPDKVKATKMPALLFQAHSSAIDFAFVPDSWPQGWRGDAIAALRGSWNRAKPTGYKLVRVKFEDGRPAGWYENFVTGFWVGGNGPAEVWGRPASVAFMPDGGLLVADDTGGTVWKIRPQAGAR